MSSAVLYTCQSCGESYKKWMGKCESCHSWNSLAESSIMPVTPYKTTSKQVANANKLELISMDQALDLSVSRFSTGIDELDRVFGGGLVKGSANLIGGDPGIGKSTLLLQMVSNIAANGLKCLYVSGEESIAQVQLRAQRLGVKESSITVASTINVEQIMQCIDVPNTFNVLVIDSIQTLYHSNISSAPGTVNQIRACAFELIRIAKQRDIALILVGHVTKDGQIAGPKVLEHMVDAVLYFEGDRGQYYRIIRAVKNRFGAANEIGVFEMLSGGLKEVSNPSALFLPMQRMKTAGTAIVCGIEGTRPLLFEVQALVVPSFLATPRRSTVGWDPARLSMIIAVLNARYGVNLLDKEVYLNITGGLKIAEPAADLGVIAALISAQQNVTIDSDTVFIGEVGLSGEVRPVPQLEARLQEALKLGFTRVVIPQHASSISGIKVVPIEHISSLKTILFS